MRVYVRVRELRSSSTNWVFYLNDYISKSDMKTAVSGASYAARGTFTDAALDQLTTTGFTESNGARPLSQGYPRIAIVLTDGASYDPDATTAAALKVQQAGIVVQLQAILWAG